MNATATNPQAVYLFLGVLFIIFGVMAVVCWDPIIEALKKMK